MEEILSKVNCLFELFKSTSSTDRTEQRLRQLNEYLDIKINEEKIYQQEQIEEILSLHSQISHFDTLLEPSSHSSISLLNFTPTSQSLLEWNGSLSALKLSLHSAYTKKQQQVTLIQVEINETLQSLRCTSESFMKAGEQAYFLSCIPVNPTSNNDLEVLKELLRQLHFEKTNYENTRKELIARIRQLNQSLSNTSQQESDFSTLSSNSVFELKEICKQLEEKADQFAKRIKETNAEIENSLLQIDRLKSFVRNEQFHLDMLKDDSLEGLFDEELQNFSFSESMPLELQLTSISEHALRIERIKRLMFEKAFEAEYIFLENIWDAIGVNAQTRSQFYSLLDKFSLEGIQKIQEETRRLAPFVELAQSIVALIQKRLDFIAKMKEFEISASDPARLFRSSFQLNQEEKFRKTAYPTLLRIETQLRESLHEFFIQTGIQFQNNYLEQLDRDINDRVMHETFFAFDDVVGMHRKGKHFSAESSEGINVKRHSFGSNENSKVNLQHSVHKDELVAEKRRSLSQKH